MEISEKIYYGLTILFFGAILVFALTYGFTDEKTAQRVLTANGYTQITFDGYGWFSCGKGDWFSTKFYATSPNGTSVEGAVCSGLFFKNSTIRFR